MSFNKEDWSFVWYMVIDRFKLQIKCFDFGMYVFEVIFCKLSYVEYNDINGVVFQEYMMVSMIFFIFSKIQDFQFKGREFFIQGIF